MKAIKANAVGGFKIEVLFDDGVSGVVDLSDLVKKGIFQTLQQPSAFEKVYAAGESIAWNEELEIDALNVYAKISKKEPAELAGKMLHHASN